MEVHAVVVAGSLTLLTLHRKYDYYGLETLDSRDQSVRCSSPGVAAFAPCCWRSALPQVRRRGSTDDRCCARVLWLEQSLGIVLTATPDPSLAWLEGPPKCAATPRCYCRFDGTGGNDFATRRIEPS